MRWLLDVEGATWSEDRLWSDSTSTSPEDLPRASSLILLLSSQVTISVRSY